MATYNRERFILEALKAIIQQSFIDWECLIIDDGGTDNTLRVIEAIIRKDSRVKYLKRLDTFKKGLPGCRNYGLSLAKGDYIIFFDDDDIVHPLNLELCLYVFKKYDDLSFCNYQKQPFEGEFDYSLLDRDRKFSFKKIEKSILEDVVTQKKPFASCTVMWKRECFKDNIFNENLMYAEEWECYQRILSTNITGVLIDKCLYFNRKHEQSNTGEYWRHAPQRVESKKEAIKMIFLNLNKKGLLTPYLFRYLLNLAISFRDFILIKNIFQIIKPNFKTKLFYVLKYYLFPIWAFYKRKF